MGFLLYLILHQTGFITPSPFTVPPFEVFSLEQSGELLPHHFTLIPTSRDGIFSVTLSFPNNLGILTFSECLPFDVRTFLPCSGRLPEFLRIYLLLLIILYFCPRPLCDHMIHSDKVFSYCEFLLLSGVE